MEFPVLQDIQGIQHAFFFGFYTDYYSYRRKLRAFGASLPFLRILCLFISYHLAPVGRYTTEY